MSRMIPILLVIIAATFPLSVEAGHGHGGHCSRCARPMSCNGCATPVCNSCQMAPVMSAPVQIMPTQIVPQSTMYLRQERVVTMQPVTRTEIRREAQTVEVPVTVQRQVTVDEGGYQSVWVPKLVTKNVSETTTQRQVQYRDVAYQVTQNVAVAQTRLVPTQTTAYVQQPVYGIATLPSVVIGPSVASLPVYTQHDGHVHSEMAAAPTPIPEPAMATRSASPTPTAVAADQSWSKVPTKSAATPATPIQLQSFETPVLLPTASPSMRTPSAASAWKAQSNFARH